MTHRPAYLDLLDTGELDRRAAQAQQHLRACDLCAWHCGVDRLAGKIGFCRTAALPHVASAFSHHGEEAPLRGWRGSGTIFFAHCNLRCQYCQNFDISQAPAGPRLTAEALAHLMLNLQAQGVHNINVVSPSHVVAPLIAAVAIAARLGLRIPLVYNTGGYDSLPALRLLAGIIDIYMPDMKYSHNATGLKYSKVRHYWDTNRAAVAEMHRQVGDLVIDSSGLAQRGLLVRHLVLPGDLAGSAEVMRFLAEEISPNTYINIMGQYHPAWNAGRPKYAPLHRAVQQHEIRATYAAARAAGLHRFDRRNRSPFATL